MVSSMASGSFQLHASETESGTYRPVVTVGSGAGVHMIDSGVVADGCMAEFPGGFQFVKPHNTSGCTDVTKNVKFICSY